MSASEALGLAYAIEGGVAGAAEARAWADAQIAKLDNPEIDLLDLALVKDWPTAVVLLHRLSQGAQKVDVGRAAYAWLLKGLSARTSTPKRVADVVMRLSDDLMAPSGDAANEALSFYHVFDVTTYWSVSDVETATSDLERHLKQYAA